jgi:hypothetical protein
MSNGGKGKMEKVIKEIKTVHEQLMPVDPQFMHGPPGDMLLAAQNWSHDSLMYFRGELLRKALSLAAAMADFAYEAHNPSPRGDK